MTGRKDWFIDLDESYVGSVSFGDLSRVSVKGKGKISINLENGKEQIIGDVYYIPEMRTNILNAGQLVEKGYEIHIRNGILEITDQLGKLITRVKMTHNRMFLLDIEGVRGQSLLVRVKDKNQLWHQRYGHLNHTNVLQLSQMKLVREIPTLQQQYQAPCESCLKEKQARKKFPSESTYRAILPLELVHVDICGPFNPASFSRYRYFMLLVDDHSRRMWVYFLREKSDAFLAFKGFVAMVERQSGCKLKALRSDRGGKFLSNQFRSYCEEARIRRPTTQPYSPQQNGVVERRNRTILDMVMSMLKSKKLPNEFWAEATRCAVYILNRSPTRSLPEATPLEAWSGKKPSVGHFKVFGCLAFAHVPSQLRSKLDDRSIKCIFIGYDIASKGYRLYNPISRKVFSSRDVVFDEDNHWMWSVEDMKSAGVTSTDQALTWEQTDTEEENTETVGSAGAVQQNQQERSEHSTNTPPGGINERSTQSQQGTSLENEDSSTPPQRMRSLQDIYEIHEWTKRTTPDGYEEDPKLQQALAMQFGYGMC